MMNILGNCGIYFDVLELNSAAKAAREMGFSRTAVLQAVQEFNNNSKYNRSCSVRKKQKLYVNKCNRIQFFISVPTWTSKKVVPNISFLISLPLSF